MDRSKNRKASKVAYRFFTCPFFGWIISYLTVVSHAGIIQNGGFELPSIAPNTMERILPASWQSVGGSIGWVFNGTIDAWPSPFEGNQFADIGNSSALGISQILSINQAGQYDLQWADNNYMGISSSIYRVDIIDGSSTIVLNETFDANHNGIWMARSVKASLLVGSYTLRFIPLGASNSADVLLDGVSMNLASSTVPEPSGLLISLGLLVPQLLRRRKAYRLSRGF